MIRSLKLLDFLTHENLDVTFGPRTFITGPNHAGKSSIRHAAEFAITGITRGLDKKNQAPALGRDGKPPRVVLTFDEAKEPVKRSATSCNYTQGQLDDLFGGDELVRLLCDSLAFVRLSPRERQKIAMRYVTRTKGPGDVMLEEGIVASGSPLIEQANDDLAAAYKSAFDERRNAKRVLAAAQEQQDEAFDPKVATSKGVADVSEAKYTLEALKGHLAKLEARKSELDALAAGGNLIAVATNRARIVEIDEKLTGKNATNPKPIQSRLATATKDAAKCRENVSGLSAKLTELRATVRKCRGGIEDIQGNKPGRCSICGAEVACTADHSHFVKDLEAQAEQAEADIAKIEKGIEDHQQALKHHEAAVAGAQKELAALSGDAAGLAAMAAEKRTLEDEIKTAEAWEIHHEEMSGLADRIGDTYRVIVAREQWEKHQAFVGGAGTRLAEHQADVDRWEKIVEFLGPDGRGRKVAADGAAGIAFPPALVAAWGTSISLEADGTLLYRGRAVEMASDSEQLAAGILCQAWLASASGQNWMVCDRLETLWGSDRDAFSQWFATSDRALQVIAITTGPAIEKCPSWLTHIRIERLAEANAAAAAGV